MVVSFAGAGGRAVAGGERGTAGVIGGGGSVEAGLGGADSAEDASARDGTVSTTAAIRDRLRFERGVIVPRGA